MHTSRLSFDSSYGSKPHNYFDGHRRRSSIIPRSDSAELFSNNFVCLHLWYIQSSQKTKFVFIKELLNSITSLSLLSATLYNALPCWKDSIYSTQSINTSLYDKPLLDHDRTLDKAVLKNTIDDYIKWFKSLTKNQQYEVLLALIRTGGGAIMKLVAFHGRYLWNTYISKYGANVKSNEIITMIRPSVKEPNVFPQTESKIPLIRSQELSKTNELKKDSSIKTLQKSLNLKSELEYLNFEITSQKIWETKLEMFRKSEGLTKSNEKIKKEESKDGSKSLDYIQMLPIWINRKIISLLDKKSLEVAKKVNNYWKELVDSVIKEKAARVELNKMIKNLNSQRGKNHTADKNKNFKNKKTKATQSPRQSNLSTKKILFQSSLPIISKINETQNEIRKDEMVTMESNNFQIYSSAEIKKWEHCFMNKLSFGKHTIVRIIQNCCYDRIIAVDRNHRYMTCNSTSNKICIYSLITGMPLHEEVDIVLNISAIDFDYDRIVLGFSNGNIKSYSFRVFTFLIAYPGHSSTISYLSINENCLLSASKEQIIAFDIISSLKLFEIIIQKCSIQILKTPPVSHNNKFFYVGLNNGKLNQYLIRNGDLFSSLDAHDGCITAIDMSYLFFATASTDYCVHIWEYNLEKKTCLQYLKHESCVTSVCIYEKYLISGCVNGLIYIWDILIPVQIRKLNIISGAFPISQLYCYLNFNRFKIIVSLGTQVLILEFNQVKRKVVRKAILHRGTNIMMPEPTQGIEAVKQLGASRRRERLNLLNDRGCIDIYLKEYLDNFSGQETKKYLFKNSKTEINLQKRCTNIFPRDNPTDKYKYELPCNVKNLPLPNINNSKIKDRFEDKSMLQLYHPYYISL